MLTHTASSGVGARAVPLPTSNELDGGKKPAYFDSARATRDTLSSITGSVASPPSSSTGLGLPPSRKRQRMSAVKTPIIADNNECWMTDGRTGENVKLNQGGRQLRQVRKEDNVGNVALLLDLVVAPSPSRESTIH